MMQMRWQFMKTARAQRRLHILKGRTPMKSDNSLNWTSITPRRMYVRAKCQAEKCSRQTGPMQNISIGFRVEDNKQCVLEELLFKMQTVYRVF